MFGLLFFLLVERSGAIKPHKRTECSVQVRAAVSKSAHSNCKEGNDVTTARVPGMQLSSAPSCLCHQAPAPNAKRTEGWAQQPALARHVQGAPGPRKRPPGCALQGVWLQKGSVHTQPHTRLVSMCPRNSAASTFSSSPPPKSCIQCRLCVLGTEYALKTELLLAFGWLLVLHVPWLKSWVGSRRGSEFTFTASALVCPRAFVVDARLPLG